MARISYTPPTSVFSLLQRTSDAMGETNDCAVKAVATVTNSPYAVAHAALKAEGRQDRKGSYRWEQEKALAKLGFKTKRIMQSDFISRYPGNHKNLKSVTTHHMDRFNKVWADGKTYLVYTSRHVGAVINGVNHDWTKGSARRVVDILEVTKA